MVFVGFILRVQGQLIPLTVGYILNYMYVAFVKEQTC